MLKRQRAPSPLADIPLLPSEPSLDIFERVVKRRRQRAPERRNGYGVGAGVARTSEEDDEDVFALPEGRSEYTRGSTRWQEEAGLYKDANTLLHDLHAEQRHRAIFSSPSPDGVTHHFHTPTDTRSQAVASYAPHQENPDRMAPPWNGSSSTDRVEVKNVTQRYEDTNRLLGSLFLSRKRQLDIRNDYNTT